MGDNSSSGHVLLDFAFPIIGHVCMWLQATALLTVASRPRTGTYVSKHERREDMAVKSHSDPGAFKAWEAAQQRK